MQSWDKRLAVFSHALILLLHLIHYFNLHICLSICLTICLFICMSHFSIPSCFRRTFSIVLSKARPSYVFSNLGAANKSANPFITTLADWISGTPIHFWNPAIQESILGLMAPSDENIMKVIKKLWSRNFILKSILTRLSMYIWSLTVWIYWVLVYILWVIVAVTIRWNNNFCIIPTWIRKKRLPTVII